MHHHCEIVIPPTMDISAAITSIMKPYCEHSDDDKQSDRKHAFWDFWVVGGRWAGNKLMAKYDPAKIDAFYEWLKAEKITISGVQFGKQELSPTSQIPKVDAKWNEMFPSAQFMPCPIFRHSNNQHGDGLSGSLPGDVQRLSDVPERVTCSHVIFAGPSWESDTQKRTGPLAATFMLTETAWNGCNHMRVDWDGTFRSALAKYRENLEHYTEEYKVLVNPKDDWLVVTVDYHS